MLNFLLTILITILTTVAVQNYVPLKYLEALPGLTRTGNLGATITTINSTDTLRDSRSVINTNFTNLNSDKIETSTTTMSLLTSVPNLATVGTITSGTWNGTGIDVARQGTGTTTLCSNNVILGNAGSGFKCTNGHGTSGQFLQSGGAGVAPTWASSAVDQDADYTWTGEHSFTSATTTVADITTLTVTNATTTKLFTSIASTASSTVLSRDSAGNVAWVPTGMSLVASSTLAVAANSISFTGIPARAHLKVIIDIGDIAGNNGIAMRFNNDTSTYKVSRSDDGATAVASTSEPIISLTLRGQAEKYAVVEIANPFNRNKSFTWQSAELETPNIYEGAGVFLDTASQITRIDVFLSGNDDMPVGSTVNVYASQF